MTVPYCMAVYSMYVAVCSNSAVADIIVVAAPLIFILGKQQFNYLYMHSYNIYMYIGRSKRFGSRDWPAIYMLYESKKRSHSMVFIFA